MRNLIFVAFVEPVTEGLVFPRTGMAAAHHAGEVRRR
jgi:hypothetical protein